MDDKPIPVFEGFSGTVHWDGDWLLYGEDVDTSHVEEPHDVVEPEYYERKEELREMGYQINEDRSGCDHDSFWIYFR